MRRALFVSAAVVLGLLVVLLLVREPERWPEPEPLPYQGEATESGTTQHASTALARLIREPQNTWSNLAFVIGGAVLLATARSRLARAVGVPLIGVGIGSFLYHASASARLRQLDVGAMYWLFALTIAVCVSLLAPKLRSFLERHAAVLTVVAFAAAVALTLGRNVKVGGFKPFSLTIATGITAAVLVLTLAHVVWRQAKVSGAIQVLAIVNVFGAAVYCQLSDRPGGALYRPDAFVQAHAVWHVLVAMAFTWSLRLLDSETASALTSQRPARS